MNTYGGGLVTRTLKDFGVKHLFSLPGHQTLSVFDACHREGLDLISTRHEASAVYMAQALSFISREPGVVLLAGGPELTNALTGVAQAYYTNIPLVVISGSNTLQKRDKGFPQDMDQLQVVRPFTKWARRCHDVNRIPEYIASAFRHAMRGRPGPVYLEIPYDVMEKRVSTNSIDYSEKPEVIRSSCDPSLLQRLIEMLQKAKRPVAIAGSGAYWSGADAEILSFVQKTHIPLFFNNAALAMPFPPEEYFGVGSLGVGRPSLRAISEADLILLLGTRLNFMLGFGQPPFISSSQQIVQIDIEPEEVGANRHVDLAILGDLKTILKALNSFDLQLNAKSLDSWRSQVKGQIDSFKIELHKLAESKRTPMHPLHLVTELEAARTDGSILVLDGANSILWALMVIKPHRQGAIILSTMGELQAIGAGVPQAIAFKRACPNQQVILHTGDGSFGYGIMEMETAIRYGIPVVVVVHNDQGWGMTRDMQVEFFGKDHEFGNNLGVVHYERMVESIGGHGEFVEQGEELMPALNRALQSGKPACVNVMVDPKPKSPGLKTFMLMEVMLGKQTFYDKVPAWMHKLQSLKLDRTATKAMIQYMDRVLHNEM